MERVHETYRSAVRLLLVALRRREKVVLDQGTTVGLNADSGLLVAACHGKGDSVRIENIGLGFAIHHGSPANEVRLGIQIVSVPD